MNVRAKEFEDGQSDQLVLISKISGHRAFAIQDLIK